MENAAFKTRPQLADEFAISTKTLYRRLREKGVKLPRKEYLSQEDCQPVYSALGGKGDGEKGENK
jgi:hypothetical protein